jgi:hypothetical protein
MGASRQGQKGKEMKKTQKSRQARLLEAGAAAMARATAGRARVVESKKRYKRSEGKRVARAGGHDAAGPRCIRTTHDHAAAALPGFPALIW